MTNFLTFFLAVTLPSQDLVPPADRDAPAAMKQGLQLLTNAGNNWQKNKTCFSCHHQPLPMLAVVQASIAGSPSDSKWMNAQAVFTHDYFKERIDAMNTGKHVPGGSATVAFGLWALALQNHKSDATTTAMVTYLLKVQGVVRVDDFAKENVEGKPAPIGIGSWIPSCNRPPLNSSRVGNTVLALMGIRHYATDEQKQKLDEAIKASDTWLKDAPLKTTEDMAWRLWGLKQWGGDGVLNKKVHKNLLELQRPDGGWAQTQNMTSDAYATGQVLFVLRQAGLPQDDVAAKRAAAFLVKKQYQDGSWLVEARAKAVQPYFDNGDPHGKHQFLSVAASSWATAALATMIPKDK